MISSREISGELRRPQPSGNSLQEKPYEKQISILKKSPLFALTLGSKELAHSNFWEWLINLEIKGKHPYVELFIEDFYEKGFKFDHVTREEDHRDISIYYDNAKKPHCHVVENKIKTLPTREQLAKYQKDFEEKKPQDVFSGTLTGLKDTLSVEAPWRFLSYDDIAERIKNIKEKNPSEYDAWIEEYRSVITNISRLINKSLDEYENKYIVSAPEKLDSVRLADIFVKFAGARETEYFKNKIEENKTDLNSKWDLPEADLSFHNKKATITIIYREKDCDKKEIGRLGIQLEGAQFRIYGGRSGGNSDLGKLYRSFMDNGWFCKLDGSTREIDGHRSSMKGSGNSRNGTKTNYCKYEKNNEYTHIYQYWDINNDVGLENIWKEVKRKLLDAKNIIDDRRISFKD